QQMVSRPHLVEAKLIKELPLISVLPPHHRRPSCCLPSRNRCSFGSSSPFSTASARADLPLALTNVRSCKWQKLKAPRPHYQVGRSKHWIKIRTGSTQRWSG